MKYQKTLAVLAGLTFAGALTQAQIAIGDNLTVSGFVDASYTDSETGATDNTAINVDEVEIDFAFSFDSVSAEIHLESKGSGVELEQAFVSTDLGGITVTAGRMLNLLGFEADEPTGLLTYSKAYSNNSNDNYNPGSQYNDGIRGSFSQGDFSISGSITDNVYAGADYGDGDGDELGYDIQVTYTGIENLSISLGYANDGDVDDGITAATAAGVAAGVESLAVGGLAAAADAAAEAASLAAGGTAAEAAAAGAAAGAVQAAIDTAEAAAASAAGIGTISNIFNISAAYSLGQLTLAGEYNDFEENSGGYAKDGDSYLLLASYAVNDDLSLILRHSEVDVDGSANDREKTTIAAGYTVTDNLSTVIEYSSGETGTADNNGFAVEGIFTF
jgi:hypothetical protein